MKETRVERTRGGGRYTEAGYVAHLKSVLRKASMRWQPYCMMKILHRLPEKVVNPDTGKLCFAGECRGCLQTTAMPNMNVDHCNPIVPSNKSFKPSFMPDYNPQAHVTLDDVAKKMFAEADAYQLLCRRCNALKSNMSMEDWLKDKDKLIASDFEYSDRKLKRSTWRVKNRRKDV